MQKLKYLPPEQHYLRLAKKPSSSAVIYTDSSQKVLLVKTSYRDYWMLPGGNVEAMESPLQAGLREIREELGADLPIKRLLGLEYLQDEDREYYHFIFWGGELDAEKISNINIQKEEITEYKFYDLDTAKQAVRPRSQEMIAKLIEAVKLNSIVYFENGKPVA